MIIDLDSAKENSKHESRSKIKNIKDKSNLAISIKT